MLINIPGFRGMVSVLAPQRLDDSQATTATNALIQSGDLVPFHVPLTQVATGISPTGNDTIYLHPSRWITWPGPVKVVRAPSANDTYSRIYFADGSNFRVTDSQILGGGYGPPSESRKIGLPVPVLPTPTFTQQGEGTVVSVTVYSLATGSEEYLPLVNCSAPHGLKTNDSIVLNVPGFVNQGPYTVVITSDIQGQPTMFRIRGFTLKKSNWSSIQKQKDDTNNGPYQLVVSSSSHPFGDGDVVLIHTDTPSSNASVVATHLEIDTPYMVDYQDTTHFQLDGTGWTSSHAYSVHGGHNQRAVCLQDASDPFYGPNNPTTAENSFTNTPNYTWSGNQYVITAYPNSAANLNQWVKTDIASLLLDRAYVATFVNGYGEEGPPSNPTPDMVMTQGTAVTFATLPTTSLYGPYDYNIVSIRFYRTDINGNWRLVPTTDSSGNPLTDSNGNIIYDVPYNNSAGFTDYALDTALADTLPTTGWYEPPSNLQGIILMPGGVLVGFLDKTVYACVPYIASAWPVDYQINVDYPIVGLCLTAAGIVVLTEGFPFLIVGTDPSSWSLVKLESYQACVSARSIVDMGEYALYASPFGIVAISQNDPQIATESVFSRLQWQAYDPATIKAGFYEQKYFGSSDNNTFIFNPATNDFVDIGMSFSAYYSDPMTDTLFVLQSDGSIAAWDRGSTYLSYTWTSKIFQMPYPCNFAAAQIISEASIGNPITFSLYGDGNLITTQSVTGNDPFRLPSGSRALNFQITVTGSARIKTIAVASSVDELKEI